MTLSFSTKWPERMGELSGQPNYFVEKILKSLPDKSNYFPALCGNCGWKGMSSLCGSCPIADTGDYIVICPKCKKETIDDYGYIELINNGYYQQSNLYSKLHTIRHDPHNRWKKGMKIHFVINNRTKNRFQFSPVLECTGVQEIEIKWNCLNEGFYYPINSMNRVKHFAKCGGTVSVKINGRYINEAGLMELAIYDGFPSVEAFFQFFDKDFSGKIIHWTDLKY